MAEKVMMNGKRVVENRGFFSSRGASAVELTMIMPFLLVLLFGIIEMSLVLYDQAMITNAAREGARQGIVFRVNPSTGLPSDYTEAEIQAVVNTYLGNRLISFNPSSAATTATPGIDAVSGARILTVQVDYNYTFLIVPKFATPIAPDVTLSAAATMRMERQ